MTPQQLNSLFTYHPTNADQIRQYEKVRAQTGALNESIIAACPTNSPERMTCETSLQQAVIWFNAAMQRGAEPESTGARRTGSASGGMIG